MQSDNYHWVGDRLYIYKYGTLYIVFQRPDKSWVTDVYNPETQSTVPVIDGKLKSELIRDYKVLRGGKYEKNANFKRSNEKHL